MSTFNLGKEFLNGLRKRFGVPSTNDELSMDSSHSKMINETKRFLVDRLIDVITESQSNSKTPHEFTSQTHDNPNRKLIFSFFNPKLPPNPIPEIRAQQKYLDYPYCLIYVDKKTNNTFVISANKKGDFIVDKNNVNVKSNNEINEIVSLISVDEVVKTYSVNTTKLDSKIPETGRLDIDSVLSNIENISIKNGLTPPRTPKTRKPH